MLLNDFKRPATSHLTIKAKSLACLSERIQLQHDPQDSSVFGFLAFSFSSFFSNSFTSRLLDDQYFVVATYKSIGQPILCTEQCDTLHTSFRKLDTFLLRIRSCGQKTRQTTAYIRSQSNIES